MPAYYIYCTYGRYTAEMVKLEASLAEMERELTRAEAAHMRERRELLDREAAAVADQERFRSRTILLQGEVGGLSLLPFFVVALMCLRVVSLHAPRKSLPGSQVPLSQTT